MLDLGRIKGTEWWNATRTKSNKYVVLCLTPLPVSQIAVQRGCSPGLSLS